eukprot:GEMP01029657.1.p2 GENE.GEMP01029657.1~~GEMP01029657.1.p2  ORF type:complete len:103 (-),score=20.40 GEMP01029657.1:745-1053(-)
MGTTCAASRRQRQRLPHTTIFCVGHAFLLYPNGQYRIREFEIDFLDCAHVHPNRVDYSTSSKKLIGKCQTQQTRVQEVQVYGRGTGLGTAEIDDFVDQRLEC